MRMRRPRKLLVEPAASASGDIVFNLIVFFLVCISTEPDTGRPQQLPNSEQSTQEQESQNVEVALSGASLTLNGQLVPVQQFPGRLKQMLAGKSRPEDKIVVLSSSDQTEYEFWVQITTMIDDAGGIVTLQLEEEQTVLAGPPATNPLKDNGPPPEEAQTNATAAEEP